MNDINEKVREIVRYAGINSDFYRELYRKAGVNIMDFRGIEDLDKLPVITPQNLIENGKSFLPDSCKPYRISSSSGTSKHPKSLYRTEEDTKTGSLVLRRLLEMAELKEGDSLLIGQPFELAHLGYLTMEACREMGIVAIPAGISQTNEKMIELINYYNPTAIFTSASRISAVMAALESGGYPKADIKSILLAGERVLPEDRRKIKEFWGVEPFDLYGSEETDGLGGSCRYHNGLHFMNDLFYLELLPVDVAVPQDSDSSFGEAVITSLYSEGTPLIRYRLGDLVEYISDSCPCGNPWPLIKVHGRLGDVLFLFDGIKLYAYQVEAVLKQYIEGLKNYQISCRTLVPGLEEVCVSVYTNLCSKAWSDMENKIAGELWNCSLDLAAARDIGSLRIRVEINKGKPYVTKRGKTPRIIDFRFDTDLKD